MLAGVGLGALLWSSPNSRRITALVLRTSAQYPDPEVKDTKINGIGEEIQALPPLRD